VEVLGLDSAQGRDGLGKDRERALGDVRRKRDRDEEPHARTLGRLEAGGLNLVADEHG